MARKHERTAARRAAAQVLYSAAIREMSAADMLKDGLVDCLEHPLTDYSLTLISGIEEHGAEIDAIISRLAKNWTLERMPLMDVTIIRIALFEMLHVLRRPIYLWFSRRFLDILLDILFAHFAGMEPQGNRFLEERESLIQRDALIFHLRGYLLQPGFGIVECHGAH